MIENTHFGLASLAGGNKLLALINFKNFTKPETVSYFDK
jgi:hypothetical protein